jgi:hypothetical protein
LGLRLRDLPPEYGVHPRAPDRPEPGQGAKGRVRAFYPEVQVTSQSYGKTDSTLPYGYLHTPGIYRTTITAPDLFKELSDRPVPVILANHGGAIEVGESTTRIPLHFAIGPNDRIDGEAIAELPIPLRDLFDVPDLQDTDDEIANGTFVPPVAAPTRWLISPRRASTTRCSGWRTTPAPGPSISRIS